MGTNVMNHNDMCVDNYDFLSPTNEKVNHRFWNWESIFQDKLAL